VRSLVVLATVLVAFSALAGVDRRAVVIGVNRSDDPEVAELRFADDDAVAMTRVLREAGVKVELLVDLDDDSRRLHRGTTPSGAPTREAVLRALDDAVAAAQESDARGDRAELWFVYSGHGNVANGEGYVVLADGKLTRSDLAIHLLRAAGRARTHVVVDACKSYFFVFPKGPGGERAPVEASFGGGEVPASAGLVLSTSSDKESHEWDRYQAGVFSHEVRSALRGAADVDADGAVTYRELQAFLRTANSAVENRRFRPDFYVRSPSDGSHELLVWPSAGETLLLDGDDLGHLYLENGVGERLVDVHPRPGAAIKLRLPVERPLFLRRARADGEFAIEDGGSVRLSALRGGPASVAQRGALNLAFTQLFARPFGVVDLKVATPAPPSAPSVVDRERPWGALMVGGATTSGLALVGGAVSTALAFDRAAAAEGLSGEDRVDANAAITLYNGVALTAYAIAIAAGVTAVGAWVMDARDPDPIVR
jgi:hypothetical protein